MEMNLMKMDLIKKKKRKGVTLIELIVVIAILGILAAIAIPRLSGFVGTSKTGADTATMKTIKTAVMTAVANSEIAGTGALTITTAAAITQDNTITTLNATVVTVMQKYLGTALPLPQNGKAAFVATIDAAGGVVVTEP